MVVFKSRFIQYYNFLITQLRKLKDLRFMIHHMYTSMAILW